MTSRSEIMKTLKSTAMQKYLKSKGIKHMSLFGSYARDEATQKSDLDVLIDISHDAKISFLTLDEIEKEIKKILKIEHIDFVTKKSLNPRLKKYVQNDLLTIF